MSVTYCWLQGRGEGPLPVPRVQDRAGSQTPHAAAQPQAAHSVPPRSLSRGNNSDMKLKNCEH